MSNRALEDGCASIARLFTIACMSLSLGIEIGKSKASIPPIPQTLELTPNVAYLTSSISIQHQIAGQDIEKLEPETLALWGRDCAINEIERRLKSHGIRHNRTRINNKSVIQCAVADLLPADIAEITTFELK
jgi:hypothetical protein